MASSADGTKLIAADSQDKGGTSNNIYISTNSGSNWTSRLSDPDNFASVASSADGTKLVAVDAGGMIWTSANSGGNWSSQTLAGNPQLQSVASSTDGTKLVAVAQGGQIYTSPDSGATWTPQASTQNWASVASSADGSKLVAVVDGGQIYTSSALGTTTTVGTNGGLTGGQGTAIELQYIGNGQFMPLSHEGSISGY